MVNLLWFLLTYALLVNGNVRVDQSSMESMSEASDAIDGNPLTYSRTSDSPGQHWTITFGNTYTISYIFIRIRGGGVNGMFYLYVNGDGETTNMTFCNAFSFNNTVINEEYIECQTPIQGNGITLQRDGEIRLFEFRPFVVGNGTVYDILSNTHLKCFETSRLNHTAVIDISRKEERSSFFFQLITKLCEDLKNKILLEDFTSIMNTIATGGKEMVSLGNEFSFFWICMGSLCGLVLLLVLGVLIRIKSKKKKRPENYDIIALQEIHENPHDLEGINSVLQEEERVYSNITSYRIPIDTFIQQVAKKKINNQLSDEFQSLSKDSCDFNATNTRRTRREDAYTRLNLDYRLNYFNASFIDGFNKERAYIAAQDPSSSSSISDFWEMIWQNNCTRVVSLTRDNNSEVTTNLGYWPNMDNKIGSFSIEIERHDVYKHYIIRQLLVKKINDEDIKDKRINHFCFTSWHHQALPECTDSLLCLRDLVKRSIDEPDEPILVHCSTGKSQTGTFIALDYLLEESICRGDIDIIACISTLRKQRPSVVQTCEEYIFLHDAIVQYFAKRRQD